MSLKVAITLISMNVVLTAINVMVMVSRLS